MKPKMNLVKILTEFLTASVPEQFNLILSGNLRYQAKKTDLKKYMGYDVLYSYYVIVELANLLARIDLGILSKKQKDALINEVAVLLLKETPTSLVDVEERKTRHDVRALVNVMKKQLPQVLHSELHIALTSYDVIDTARALMFKITHQYIVRPLLARFMCSMGKFIKRTAHISQIGRTHGQHALPITVGYWMANIDERILYGTQQLDESANELIGKISGPTGSGNAITLFELDTEMPYEMRVLKPLGLKSHVSSTQIVHPEPLARYLFNILLISGAIAQVGEDVRNLSRPEIDEIVEGKISITDVGSSAMPHKANPINAESLCGFHAKNIGEFTKVMLTLTSDHQRDLRWSGVYRDFMTMVVNLVEVLSKLTELEGEGKKDYLERLIVNEKAIERNLAMSAKYVIAEPLYMALQKYGYTGDGHKLLNDIIVPKAKLRKVSVFEQLKAYIKTHQYAETRKSEGDSLQQALINMPGSIYDVFEHPEKYTGYSEVRALKVAKLANNYAVFMTA